MTDSRRLDFLDAINRQANSHGGPPQGWTIHLKDGVLTLSDDGPRVRPIREVLDEFWRGCESPVHIARNEVGQVLGFRVVSHPAVPPDEVKWVDARMDEDSREIVYSSAAGFEKRVRWEEVDGAPWEDVRALALEHEERRAAQAEDRASVPAPGPKDPLPSV